MHDDFFETQGSHVGRKHYCSNKDRPVFFPQSPSSSTFLSSKRDITPANKDPITVIDVAEIPLSLQRFLVAHYIRDVCETNRRLEGIGILLPGMLLFLTVKPDIIYCVRVLEV